MKKAFLLPVVIFGMLLMNSCACHVKAGDILTQTYEESLLSRLEEDIRTWTEGHKVAKVININYGVVRVEGSNNFYSVIITYKLK